MYARYQATLAELTQAVLANTHLSTLMRLAVTLVAHTLAVAYSAIWELLPNYDALVLRAGIGWQEDTPAGTTVAVEATSSIGSSVLGTAPVIVADWPSETQFSQPQLLRNHGVISSLLVVIPGPGQPFGSLGVDVTASRVFGDEEIQFLQAVANVLALAIKHARFDQLIEQRVEERTREVELRLGAASQDKAVLEERQRLARDLHDSVAQALYGVTLHAEVAKRLLASGDVATAAGYLHSLQDTAQEALDEMRLLIFELRPPILEQAGLAVALQTRLGAVEGRTNLQTKLIVDEVSGLPAVVEQALYGIARETLNNTLKHARAQHITVHLWRTKTSVFLEVTDDGVGFDPATARKKGGLGLLGIAERVAQLGGELTLQSAPGVGTQLRVEVTL